MMKKLIFLFITLACTQLNLAQTFVQGNTQQPTCFNTCDGSVVYSTTTTAGPFTASLSNSSSCSNAIQQSSTGNTITITNLCVCAGVYTINFYNSSNIIVGSELLQVPITATTALILQTPSVNPAACSTCCDGQVYVNWAGGYVPSPSNPTITIDAVPVSVSASPNASVCVGNHTICITDLAGCVVCTTFSMGFVNTVGVVEQELSNNFSISPNPAKEELVIEYEFGSHPIQIRVYDLFGKIVLEEKEVHSLQKDLHLNIERLPVGVYFIELKNTQSVLVGRKKFIKLQS